MDAGARGCLVVLSGKITGARQGPEVPENLKYGQVALDVMDSGFATAVRSLEVIGCTVRTVRPGTRLPHEIIIRERAEAVTAFRRRMEYRGAGQRSQIRRGGE